jgi:group I intron endonuclease
LQFYRFEANFSVLKENHSVGQTAASETKALGDVNRPGVYEISTPTINGFVYYGSAAHSISRRWRQHRHDFRKGKHGNPWLHAIVQKYGLSVLVFRVVENCAPCDCLATEQRYIDACPRDKRYNLSPIAGSRLGAKLTDDQKLRMAMKRGGVGSLEVRCQIVAEYENGSTQAELAKKYGVDRASIRNYLRRKEARIRLQPARDVELQRIIAESYHAGEPICRLAQKHKLDYGTVIKMLKQSGVRLRSNSRRQQIRFHTIEARRIHARTKGGKAYRFIHRVHGEFVGYPFELAERFSLSSSGNIFQVIKGTRPAYRGWELAGEGKAHEWKCPDGGRLRKLTPAQVTEVRELLRRGVTQTSIAAKFNIDQSSISRIKTAVYRYAM